MQYVVLTSSAIRLPRAPYFIDNGCCVSDLKCAL